MQSCQECSVAHLCYDQVMEQAQQHVPGFSSLKSTWLQFTIHSACMCIDMSTVDIKCLFSDNCHKYVHHFLCVSTFWDHKIHINGNGVCWNTGNKRMLVHWKQRMLGLMLGLMWTADPYSQSGGLLHCPGCWALPVAEKMLWVPHWQTSSPSKADHGEHFIPEWWAEFFWNCTNMMAVT